MTTSYRLRHTTRYQYSAPVSVCQNMVCLTPTSTERQIVRNARLSVSPKPETLSKRNDGFGNVIHSFAIETAHEELVIQTTARITVLPPESIDATKTQSWESVAAGVREQNDPQWFNATPFLFDSDLVRRKNEALGYGQICFTPNRPILEAATELMHQVHRDFEYKSGVTGVETNSDDALNLRAGVCQDFAHVAIAALRSLGIPALYVSGYLRTEPPAGAPRLVGADQSHAWFGVYCGSELGWVELDPTNAILANSDHIRVAIGRDYRDVAPVRGVYLGGGDNLLQVEVDVVPVE